MDVERALSHRWDIGYAYDEVASAITGADWKPIDLANSDRYARDKVRAYAEVGMGRVIGDTYSTVATEICDSANPEAELVLAAISGDVRRVNDHYRRAHKIGMKPALAVMDSPVIEMPAYLTGLPKPDDPENEPWETSAKPRDLIQALRFAAVRFWVPYRGRVDEKTFLVKPGSELWDIIPQIEKLEPGQDVLHLDHTNPLLVGLTSIDPDTRPEL